MSLMVTVIAWIELAIGAVTLAGMLAAPAFAVPSKPPSVTAFVVISSCASAALGAGLLRRDDRARRLIVFFSGYILLTKLLIFAGLLEFKGDIVTLPPAWVKNAVSVCYHGALIAFFGLPQTKALFGGRR